MRYLLDTSVAVHLRDGDPNTHAWMDSLDERPALSIVTRIELEGGVYAKPAFTEKRRHAVDALIEFLEVLDFDDAAADRYGIILAQTGFSRRKIVDRMIAATAIVHRLTLVTANPRDFGDVPDLSLEKLPIALFTPPPSEAPQ